MANEKNFPKKINEKIRQDRNKVINDNLKIEINQNTYEIFDYSYSGISFLSNHNGFKNSDHFKAKIFYGSVTICELELKVVRDEKYNDDIIKICLESINEKIPVKSILSFYKTEQISQQVLDKKKEICEIPSSFRLAVYDLKKYLMKAEQELNAAEKEINDTVKAFDDEYKDSLALFSSKFLASLFEDILENFVEIASKNNIELSKKALSFFRDEISVIFLSPAAKRFFEKPLKYAGDFEMMNILYRNSNEGETLFAQAIHYLVLNHPHGQAVRNRVQYLGEKLTMASRKNNGGVVKILSVASGPAEEVKNLILTLEQKGLDNIEIHLLDQDIISLKYAQMNIKNVLLNENKKLKIELLNNSINQLLKNGLDEKYDLIYSAGLFDYFSDKTAMRAGESLYSMLKEDGTLIIGNFDYNPKNHFFMELFFDWNLIYRTKEDLVKLFVDFCPQVKVESEKSGVNLFSILTK